jgi:hypothetical protein
MGRNLVSSTEPSLMGLIGFLETTLSARSVLYELGRRIRSRGSLAGSRHEEVFTREFLCPAIAKYFYEEIRAALDLKDHEIQSGLGTEGFQNCCGFGFTPARKSPHLFTKSDIIKSTPPPGWVETKSPLPRYQACPDFAIKKPLPVSVVGEVKYFRTGSKKQVVKELYDGVRQVAFYLGAFRRDYDNGLLVVADASPSHAFVRGISALHPKLIPRFGSDTGIYLLQLRLI